MLILRLILSILAVLLILVGIVAMIAPTPLGFVVVLAGLLLLAIVAPGVVKWLRKHWRWLDRVLDAITAKLPSWLRKEVEKSDPPDEDEPGDDDDEEDDRLRTELYDG